jgi:N6-L-threonylcarbamoyladenine synthase
MKWQTCGIEEWGWRDPVLGIETSCDETAAAVVARGRILSNVVFSQTEHGRFGGVVPELASRNHIRKVIPTILSAFEGADLSLEGLSGIAVTQGPGLAGCLLVGISVAKGMALASRRPLVGIHHIEGHLIAGALEHPDLKPPFLALVASGGHTELIHVIAWGDYRVVGKTRDDAAGEAFDKVAKLLGLLEEGKVTMGGPPIAALAASGDPAAFDFPRGLRDGDGFDFSFSGLKTAVLYHLRSRSEAQNDRERADVAASFQAAVVDVLVQKTLRGARRLGVAHVVLTGGVAANVLLREELTRSAAEQDVRVTTPSPHLCTDNAAMIAAAGAFRLACGERSGLELDANPRLALPGDGLSEIGVEQVRDAL